MAMVANPKLMTVAEYHRWQVWAKKTDLFAQHPEYEFALVDGIIKLTDLPSWYGDDADDDDESDDESENEEPTQ